MYRVPKTNSWQFVQLQKQLYLINIGLYSLAIYLSIFSANKITGWWVGDPWYRLDYALFIWFPIGLLLINPFIWQRTYTLKTLVITASSLLGLNIFLAGFMRVDFSDADQVGWGVLTLLSAMFSLYAWYRAKPWRKFKNN